MAGYTRQSTYTDGDVINAADSNDEFDQVLAAFNNSTGHKHDGTAAEGPVIGLIGDPGETTPKNKVVVDNPNNQIEVSVDVSGTSTEQFVFKDGVIEPTTNNDIDLGSSSKQFKDLHIDGVANVDSIAMPTTTVTDILDEDNMSSNSASALATQQSIKAYVDTQLTAEDLDFQADTGGALSIDLDSETLTFTGGTGIDTSGSGNAVTFAIDSTVTTLTGSQTLTNKTLTTPTITTPVVNAGLQLKNGATSAGFVEFFEDSDNGTNKATLIGPASTADVTLTLPAATDTLVGKATTDTLTNKTLTSAVLNDTISGTSIKDEDDMSSDSADHLATQQSIKAYVDSQVTAQDLDFQADTGGALSIDLDSETMTFTGGTGIDTSGSGNAVTFAIDSTVATLTGSQALTNKTIDVDNNTVSNIEVDNFKGTAIVTEAEGISSSDNDTSLPTTAAVKDYVDTQITAEDLDITTDSGTIAIDLDSETLTVAGGTGLDSSATGNTVTLAIDSTVATLSGTQTLTNKSIDASQLTGTVANARLDAELQALAGLTSAADKGIQFTGSGTAATYDLTAAGKALLDDADASAQRTTMGVAIGSDVQAYDAGLASIAGLTTAANKVIYTTASDTYAVADFTAFGRSLVDDADAAAGRTTLGLGTAATSASTDFDAAGSAVVMAIALG